MSSVGETLRQERVRRNLSLDQIAAETKISARLLEAIEKEQFDRLPGGVFAKSFVRQYARTLGLEGEELATEVGKMLRPETDVLPVTPPPSSKSFKVPKIPEWEGASHSSSSALPSLILVVAVMLVCSGIYAWWQRSKRPAPPVAPAVAATNVAPAPKSARPAAPLATPVNEPAAEPAAQAAALHVSLAADEDTWVRAWADGKEVMTATLQPNVIKTVDASDEIRLRTGNAGALQVTFNGKSVGPIGPKGQIRIVQVTPKGVQIETPAKPAPPPPTTAPASTTPEAAKPEAPAPQPL